MIIRSAVNLSTAFLKWVAILFILPLVLSAGWWALQDRPANWRNADWSSTGMLPEATSFADAAIHVMAARTGGFKGAFSVHSWIVIKPEGADRYERYDKVGWGNPVRKDAYAADARWYSNTPFIVKSVTGPKAAALIDDIRDAVASYPYDKRGDYRIWPGPNSNTFVAHVLRAVPQLGATLPPNAVGKDYIGNATTHLAADHRDFSMSLAGLAGFSVGVRSGLEVHLLGQTFGIDIATPALKLPGIGRFGLQ